MHLIIHALIPTPVQLISVSWYLLMVDLKRFCVKNIRHYDHTLCSRIRSTFPLAEPVRCRKFLIKLIRLPMWNIFYFIGFVPEVHVKNNFRTLRWRHNELNGVSDHQPHDCLLNQFGRWSKKTSKLCVTGLCAGNSSGPVNSPHKWPVTRKSFHMMMSSWYG